MSDLFSPFATGFTPPPSPPTVAEQLGTMATSPGDVAAAPTGATAAPAPSSASSGTTLTQAPKWGGIFAGNVVWIGGPPNANFDGSSLMGPATPLCLRNLDASSEIKGFVARTKGSELKFKRDDPDFTLIAFADEALKHMQLTGMDSVFYLKGADSSGVGAEELFTYHTRYSKHAVDEFIKDQMGKGTYDRYQQAALNESALWLTNSLDESLKTSLRTQLASRPTGPQLWMHIVSEVQSDSLKRCDHLAEKFRALTLSQFKGENVRDYAAAAGNLLTQLERDQQLPRTHLLKIVDVFSKCTVMDFRIHWMGRRSEVNQFVKDSSGKDAATVLAMPNRIHFQDLLDEGKDLFTDLKDQWGPAKAAGPAAALLTVLDRINARVAQLDQKLHAKTGDKGGGDEGGKKELKCFKCGKPGFTKKTCPDCNSPNGNGSGKPPPTGTGKWSAPKDGEPKEKMINGSLHKWCSKCRKGQGRWTKDHSTEEHKVGFLRGKRDKDEGGSGTTPANPSGTLACVPMGTADSQTLMSAWGELQV